MTKRSWTGYGCAVVAALTLQACGGGGSSDTSNPDPVAQPSTVAHAQGVVYDISNGLPLPGVTITVGDTVQTSDAQGRFDLTKTVGSSLDVKASLPGYGDGQAHVDINASSTGANIVISLSKVAVSQALNISAGGSVTVPNSTAQVSLTAASLVDATSGQPATGQVKVTIAPIDPASQTSAMPGNYKADNGQCHPGAPERCGHRQDLATGWRQDGHHPHPGQNPLDQHPRHHPTVLLQGKHWPVGSGRQRHAQT